MKWIAHGVRIPVILAAVICGTVLAISGKAGTGTTTPPPASPAARQAASQPPAASRTGEAFGGVATVGALFTVNNGKLGTHFCTASVVHSLHGDLAVTAAHCVTGNTGQIVFVPGYANGTEPYGVWQVTAIYTDQAWQSSADPDDDVAFLRLAGGTLPASRNLRCGT